MAADKCTGLRLRYFYLEVSCVIMVAFGDEKNSESKIVCIVHLSFRITVKQY